jgi:hypothetical protein
MSVINLGLHVVDLRCGGRQRHKGARLSEAELLGFACGRWLVSRQALRVALQVIGPHCQYYKRCDYH